MSLNKTEKKGRAAKARLIEQIRAVVAEYPHAYLFRVRNMRNVLFKTLRTQTNGRFFVGKNKVMAVALGRDEASECIPGGAQLAQNLRGDVGLLLSRETPEALNTAFSMTMELDYARTGNKADMTVVVEADPAGLRSVETGEPLPASVEPYLREAGMPTMLRGGSVLLNTPEYTVCVEGECLTANQARILKLIGVKMATFQVEIIAHLFEGEYEEFCEASVAGDVAAAMAAESDDEDGEDGENGEDDKEQLSQ